MQPHARLNAKLKALAATNPRLHYVDCTRLYLEPGGTRLSPHLIPDGLHPGPAGAPGVTVCGKGPILHALKDEIVQVGQSGDIKYVLLLCFVRMPCMKSCVDSSC